VGIRPASPTPTLSRRERGRKTLFHCQAAFLPWAHDREERNILTAGGRSPPGTLASRVLDWLAKCHANLLGMSQGGVMDAFAIAFPDPEPLPRASARPCRSYCPCHDPVGTRRKRAWQLTSVARAGWTVILSGGRGSGSGLWGWSGWAGARAGMRLVG